MIELEELTVQKVYDTLQERIFIINRILSACDDGSSKFTCSDKLRNSLSDMKLNLCGYVRYIDGHGDEYKEEPANKVLSDVYFSILCPDKKG